VLVATDIVARGIDIEELGDVVNFDVPADPDAVSGLGGGVHGVREGTLRQLARADPVSDHL
jgi:superfamily II DNA/RNA helicase